MMAFVTPRGRGFTLLEMLLVVFILSTLALTTLAFVDNQDDQFRFEDSRRRLEMIWRAIVGDTEPVYGGQVLVSGYVADNGDLPMDMTGLTGTAPAHFALSGLQSPRFDPTPEELTGLDSGAEVIPLDDAAEKLEKGWRPGYLRLPPGDPAFTDGWGFAWLFDASVPDTRVLGSQGKDNAPGGDGYKADMTSQVLPAHWSVDIAGLSVYLRTTEDLYLPSPAVIRVSMLVFINTGSGPRWLRLTTDGLNCLDGDGNGSVDHDADKDTPELPCPNGQRLSFLAHTSRQSGTRIPVGRHLLVVVQDDDGDMYTSDDSPQLNFLSGPARRITRPVQCYPAGCHIETLVLR